MTAATFAALFAALYVGHVVGDHWVQTQHQSDRKGLPGWPGRLACASHVATYTLTQAAAVAAVCWRAGLGPDAGAVAAGLFVSAASHYVADRRTPLLRLAELLQPIAGKASFYRLGSCRPDRDDNPSLGTGAYALDQSWHVAWLLIAALVMI